MRKRYRTNQLTVEAKASRRTSKVVMLRVSVKLLDRKENIHVGMVMVMKLTTQYNRLGMMVKTPSSRPPSMPADDWPSTGPVVLEAVGLLTREVSVSVTTEGIVPSIDETAIFSRGARLTCLWAALLWLLVQ